MGKHVLQVGGLYLTFPFINALAVHCGPSSLHFGSKDPSCEIPLNSLHVVRCTILRCRVQTSSREYGPTAWLLCSGALIDWILYFVGYLMTGVGLDKQH